MRQPVLFVALVLAASTTAESAPNFSGVWRKNREKSYSGSLVSLDEIRWIRHNGSNIGPTIQGTRYPGPSISKTHFDLVSDRQPRMNNTSIGLVEHERRYRKETVTRIPVKTVVFWEGESLSLEFEFDLGGKKTTKTELWTLGSDGKALSVKVRTEAGMMRLEFEKSN